MKKTAFPQGLCSQWSVRHNITKCDLLGPLAELTSEFWLEIKTGGGVRAPPLPPKEIKLKNLFSEWG